MKSAASRSLSPSWAASSRGDGIVAETTNPRRVPEKVQQCVIVASPEEGGEIRAPEVSVSFHPRRDHWVHEARVRPVGERYTRSRAAGRPHGVSRGSPPGPARLTATACRSCSGCWCRAPACMPSACAAVQPRGRQRDHRDRNTGSQWRPAPAALSSSRHPPTRYPSLSFLLRPVILTS